MNIKQLFLIAFFSAVSHALFAQTEICNNGLDDDFDGFIDCYDGSCANSPLCDGIFLGNDATCTSPPPVFPQFTMTLDFSSPNQTTNHLARMAVGDLDRDGTPEIISMNRYTRTLYILNGNNGSIKRSVVVPWEPYWEIAIANLDNDSCAEIFFIGYDTNGTDGVYMYGYDCNLNLIWRTAQPFLADPINFGVADFDGDGLEEIYAKDEIFDAKTGVRIIRSSATTTTNYNRLNGGPVAVNMGTALAAANNTNLELVLGPRIFQVNLGARTVDSGSLTLLQQRTDYFIRNAYNATSVADFNQDGFLDVLASGSTGSHGSNTTVFFWDVKNNQLRTFRDGNTSITATLPPPLSTTTVYPASDYGSNGWGQGTGRLNVADLDGDGRMNVSYVSGKYLYALKDDFTLLWRKVINEETSGYTGCTLFDFNGDGRAEIVYRDERFLYIIQGRDGSIYSQQACISRTNREYPIVADVDADGSTELCVTCGFNDTRAAANFNTLDSSRYSHVRVFKSAAEPWVPARRVWNQHGYFVVNVNDDLTIPRIIQPHQTVFSTGSCTQGPNRPLNKFLNQSPYLNSEGCPTYAAPDIAFSVAPTVVPPTCPNLNFQVSFAITNLGDLEVTGNIPVTFYTTNPKRAGSVKLNTITLAVNKLSQGDVVTVSGATVTGIGSDSLYVVLNDAGTSVPTPIVLPNTTFFECNYDNIRGVRVRPRPVQLNALKVNDAENCSATPSGVARAFIPISGGGENTADYNFYWSIGAVAKPIASADYVGAIYSGLNAGTYTVYARHKTANCNSDTVRVTINSLVSIVPDVTVNVIANQTSCTPNNGRLQAVIAGGGAGYTIDWYDIALNPLGITGPTANNLPAGSYLVIISKGTCTKSSAPVSITGPSFANAVGQVTKNVQDCSNPNSGEITAQALVSGVPQNPSNYTFDWYNYNSVTSTQGSILSPIHGTGPTRTGLPVGSYQVVIRDNSTGCVSTSFPVSITSNTVIPTVQITQVAPQTSCDPTNPNGVLRADVFIGGVLQNPADFTFQWFKGQNTLPANLVSTTSGTNGQIVNKVAGGGIPYTVKITTSFNCTAISDFTVAESLINPVVTLTTSPNGVCNPSLASSTYTGSVTATVTFNGTAVTDFTNYSFGWHRGNLATDPAPTPNSTTNVLNQQNGGQYTLVVNRTDLGCASAPVTATISNVAAQPTLTTNDIGSTNCVAGLENGSAEVVTVDGSAVGTVSNYSYQWHTGTNTATPILIATNATAQSARINNIQGGVSNNYTVLVTNTTSGCQSTATVLVPDLRVLPLVTLAKTDNTICSPATSFDGTVTASVTNIPGGNTIANYTFVFGGGQNVGVTAGNVYSVLNGGPTPYTAVATHTPTGCQSSQVSIVVNNNQNLPDLVTGNTGSTNCIAGLENGRARVVTVDGAAASTVGFTYSWVGPTTPAFPVTGNATNDDIELQNVQGGTGYDYTVTVTNTSNGCVSSALVNVPDSRVLPLVTLAKTDNTICSPATSFDGTVTASVTNIPGGNTIANYTFVFGGGQNVGVTAGNVYSVLNGGPTPYTAVATHTPTGCQSSQVSIVVNNNQNLPDLVTGNTGSTNCIAGLENGRARVVTVDGAAASTVGFTYSWVGPTTPAFPVTGNATNDDIELQNVQGGTGYDYTVTVTNTSNGCVSSALVNVPDSRVLPLVTLAKTDNTICSPATSFDGTVTASVTNIPGGNTIANYTFVFGGGQNVGVTAGNVYSVLNGGPTPYTAVATHTPTGCQSSQVSIVVNNNQNLPDLVTGNTGSTNCIAGLENGRARVVTVDGAAASTVGFTYSWVGPTTPAFPVTGNATNDDIELQNVQGGTGYNYTITVTNLTNGCVGTSVVNVPDNKSLPTLTLTPQPNTICDPSKVTIGTAAFDGQVGAAVNAVGNYTGSVAADFNFVWSGGTTPPSGIGVVTYAGLDVGTYSVVATHTNTGCQSNSFSANVTSAKTLPSISMSQIPSQNCTGGAPDGTAQVTNVLPNGRNYEYLWFEGNSTSGTAGPVIANTTATTSNFSNVRGGINGASLFEYTVQVTILQTGCVNTATVGVSSDSQLPIVALAAPVNNTNCSPTKNGSAALSTLNYRGSPVAAPYTGFTFNWSGTGTVGPAPGNTFTQLAAGTYTLTVTNTNDNCVSNPVPVTIADDLYIPVINVTDVDQTSCNLATPNGSLTATVNDVSVGGTAASTAGYSFAWVDNVDASHTGSASLFSGLKGNQNYTVTVTRTLTGCTSFQTAFVDESVVLPTVTVTPTPLSICSSPNGEVNIATVSPGVIGDYEYFWYDGSDATDAASIIASPDFSTGSSYTGLIPGEYTVVARNTSTRCVSAPVISTVTYSGPVINPVVENTVVPAICNALGSMTGGMRTSNTTTFTGAVNDELTLSANIGLAVGNRVIIKRDGVLPLPFGVEENKTYYVKSVLGLVIILEDAPAGTQINLTSVGNGIISNFISPGAALTYEWFDGVPTGTTPADPINLFSNPPNFGALVTSGTVTGPVYSGIPDGLYTLKVTDNATGCFNYVPHTLPFIGSHAVIRISKTNSTVCPPSPDDGSITIQIEDPSTAPGGATYDISVTGPTAVPPVAGAVELNNYTLSTTLIPGTYIVTVRQNYGSNCELDQDVIIGRDAFNPVVTLASAITPNNACDNTQFNGAIQINIAADPDDLVAGQDYDIDMTIDPNNAFPINNQVAGNYTANNLGPNTYQFTVTSSTGCSVSKSFTVLNNPVLSQILNANVNAFDAEYCTPTLEQSARALVTQINLVSGAADDLDDYRFNWYSSGSLFTASAATNKVTFTAHGFANNDRVLLIIDGTFPTGLSPNAEYFVKAATANDFELSLTAGGSTVDITANGTLRIARNQLSALGNSTVTKGGEEFSNTAAPLPSSPVTIGTYYVTATKITDTNAVGGIGCASAPLTVTIGDNTIKPTIALTPTGDTACSTTVFEGSIEVDMSTASGPGSVVGATYSYAWTPNGGAGQPANSAGNNGINNVIGNLNDGTYTLTATNQLTGCQNSLATTIIRATPPIFTLTADVVNLTTCNLAAFNGEINNLQVFVNGAGGNEPDFDYVWFRSDLLPASKVLDGENVGVPVDDELTLATYPAIALDKYFVKAIRKAGGAGVGCESAALRKDILDDRVYPQISFATTPNTSCNNEFDGSITVTATTSGFAAASTNYNFDWTSNPGGAVVITDAMGVLSNPSRAFQSQALGGPAGERIGPGAYGITVTNTVNQCATTGTVSVQQNTVPVTITGTSSTPLTHCTVPNGTTQVTTVDVGSTTGVALGNFVFSWTGPGGPHPNGTNLASLSSGDYFVTAQKTAITTPASGCSSTPVRVTVLDQRQFPVVSFATTPNTSCNNEFDGSITVTATTSGFAAASTNYNFDWTSNPGGAVVITDAMGVLSNPSRAFQSQALGGPAGERIGPGAYGITVTNTVNQCATTGTVSVQQNTVPVTITGTSSTPLTHCTVPNGTTQVTTVDVGSTTGVALGNFVFSWTGPGGPHPNGTNLASLSSGDYFVTGQKTAITTPASGCSSTPVRVTVLDQRQFPVVSFATTPNTSCNNEFDGSITVTATTSGFAAASTNYNFDWTSNPGGAVVITDAMGVLSNPSRAFQSQALGGPAGERIGPGAYGITVTNTVNQCATTGTVSVQQNTVPVTITGTSSTPLTHCTVPNGTTQVTTVDVGSTTGVALGNFVFSWTGPGGPHPNGTNLASLSSGDYFVTAQKTAITTPASGCSSTPVRVTVLDQRQFPVLSFNTTASTACDTNHDGQITVTATTAGFVGPNYNFDWTSNPAGTTITDRVGASPYTYQAGDVIGQGSYSISVTNQSNMCAITGNVAVLQNSPSIEILTHTKTDQLICNPDGSITVTSLSLGTPANYSFNWFRNSTTSTALVDGASATIITPLLDRNNYPTMGADTFFVRATRNPGSSPGSGCVTAPYRVDVLDRHVDPRIQFASIIANSTCDVTLANGGVLANASEQSGTNTDTYSFTWQRNGSVLPVITTVNNTTNSSRLTSAPDGNYTLTITNTTGTGCSTSATVELLLDRSRSTPNIIDVSTIDPVDCNPTGSATVLKITLGSTTNSLLFPPNVPPNNEVTGAGLLSYNYEWYTSSVNASNQLPLTGPPFTVTPSINSLLPGTYFVLVRDPSTNCLSGPKEVVIEDDNIVYPDLNVTQTVKQLSCISTTGTAVLAATADGQTDTNANYRFNWFSNLTNTAPVFASTSTISNLLTGNYSITVLDLTTNCRAQASYIVQDESALFTPIVSMGGQPRTLCVGTDGSVLARVSNADATYPFGYNASTFTADLFNGTLTNPSGTPAVSGMPRVAGFFTSFVQTGLNEGFYTVRIRDNNTGCVGIGNHEIKDERIYPQVGLEKIAPMTNCDPARPNGVARVSVNGGFSGFQFDWYAGTTVSGTPLFVGPQFDQLRAAPQQYVIRATNLVSGCTSDLPANFVNGTVPIPTPTIEKLSDVTSCVISNGALTVYVGTDKNTKDYIFNWYDGTTETPPVDFIGETYTDLAAGNYSVTATSVITGCKSPLRIGEVVKDQDFPDFDFLVQSTSCDKNDGYATLIMTSDVPIERIEWSNSNGPFLNGPNFTEAMAGTYTVTATSFFGCSTTKDVEIKPDIRPFNGISRNGDGQNDFFKINCIQNFPENLVKIFNRAGTLVYEAVGYDNATIYFDGKSNKGVSPMGVNLPDGTYFYIVDKRDGSKPIAGYLEIVN